MIPSYPRNAPDISTITPVVFHAVKLFLNISNNLVQGSLVRSDRDGDNAFLPFPFNVRRCPVFFYCSNLTQPDHLSGGSGYTDVLQSR